MVEYRLIRANFSKNLVQMLVDWPELATGGASEGQMDRVLPRQARG
jgi:hypothetical protein